jgi:hypothetical protein
MHDLYGYGLVEGRALIPMKFSPSYSSQGGKLKHKTEKVTNTSEVAHDLFQLVQMFFFRTISVQELVGGFQFKSLGGVRFGWHDDGNRELGRRSVEVLVVMVLWRKKSFYLCFSNLESSRDRLLKFNISLDIFGNPIFC